MNKLLKKPHLIFWLTIPIVLLIGFVSGTEPLDINIHDTYFVIHHIDLAVLISIYFGIIGLGYWSIRIAERKLFKTLTLLHIILTVGGFLLLRILMQMFPERAPESTLADLKYSEDLNVTMIIIALVVIFGQVVYPINLIIGLIRKRKETSG